MAHDMKPDGSEARQLGFVSWNVYIGTGKRTASQSLEVTVVKYRECLVS